MHDIVKKAHKKIDARGLACPAPVLETRKALHQDRPKAITVIVDNTAAQQNVQRFLESQGFKTITEKRGDDYMVLGIHDPSHIKKYQIPETKESNGTKIMVICATDRFGSGDDILGKKLMINFLRTLNEMGKELWRLVFVNYGVKLTVDGSEVIEDLQDYEKNGVRIMVCGTCLDHFNILEKKQVGETTNMLDIVTAMQIADKVINI